MYAVIPEKHDLKEFSLTLNLISKQIILVDYDSQNNRASDFPFQKKQFSVSKQVKFRFDSVSLLAMLNSMKSQYIERKCGERTVKMAQLVRWTEEKERN